MTLLRAQGQIYVEAISWGDTYCTDGYGGGLVIGKRGCHVATGGAHHDLTEAESAGSQSNWSNAGGREGDVLRAVAGGRVQGQRAGGNGAQGCGVDGDGNDAGSAGTQGARTGIGAGAVGGGDGERPAGDGVGIDGDRRRARVFDGDILRQADLVDGDVAKIERRRRLSGLRTSPLRGGKKGYY